MHPRSARVEDDDDSDLKLALQMSLEEARRSRIDVQPAATKLEPIKPVVQPTVAARNTQEAEDQDLKAAIAASLKDMENKKTVEYPPFQPVASPQSQPTTSAPLAQYPQVRR